MKTFVKAFAMFSALFLAYVAGIIIGQVLLHFLGVTGIIFVMIGCIIILAGLLCMNDIS